MRIGPKSGVSRRGNATAPIGRRAAYQPSRKKGGTMNVSGPLGSEIDTVMGENSTSHSICRMTTRITVGLPQVSVDHACSSSRR